MPADTCPAMEGMAREVVATARTLGQRLEYHTVTRGDGNCFYHALLDQVRNRPEVSELIPPRVSQSGALNDHLSLRSAIVKFARGKLNPVRVGHTESSLQQFLLDQSKPSTYAQDEVINLAPEYLGVDIWFISAGNRPDEPYAKLYSGQVPTAAHIILGYIREHFQSLHPVFEAQVSRTTGPPPAKKPRLSDAERMSIARAMETEDMRAARLDRTAHQNAERRNTETSAEKDQRLAAMADYTAQLKQAETPAERQQRLAAEALHKAQTKEAETPTERQQRLAAEALHKAQTRQNESQTERDQRLTAASQAMSQLREIRRSQASTSADAADTAEPARPEFWEHGLEFHRAMEARNFHVCLTCSEINFTVASNDDDSQYVCRRCNKDPVTFSAENNMDPGPVPEELAGLTQVEQLLIAQIIPTMTIVRLPRGGQFGYSGNIINLPQDLPSLVSSLPRRVTDTDIVVIRKQLEQNTHRDFRVRRSVVQRALQYLRAHNPFYAHIDINDDNLQLLPEDDFVDVPSVRVPDADEGTVAEEQQSSTPSDATQRDDGALAEMSSTFLPLNVPRVTETAAVEETLHVAPIQWPAVADRPVNEFETVGYVTRCFPALFPTGAAELRTMQPREKRVTEPPYFKHLILYKDQRFAQHPRFRYFAYNTLIRHRSLATGRMYLRQHPDSAVLLPEEILAFPEAEKRRLAHDIVRFGGHLRGSRQYWCSQRENLMALINQLGTPHCYFTLSSADMQWPDLQGYLRRFGGVQSPSAAVASNPLLCTWYMHERVTLFLESFLRDVLGLHTYWARHEYQHRGSLHTHGVGYLREGVDVAEVIRLADTFSDRLTAYVDSLITAWHPAPPVPGQPFVPPVPHPCAKRFADVDDCECDYESLLNCVQRHTRCAAGYCLRKKRGSDVAECRFGYPKPLVDTTTVSVSRSDHDKVEVTIEPKRNDPLLNCHNRALVQTWRANVDFQLIQDRRKVIEYLAKYISKAEPESQDLKHLLDVALRSSDSTSQHATRTAVQRLLVKAVCERDISAQEVCHHLLELPMVLCTRQFHVLAVDGLYVQRELVSENARGGRVSKCDVDAYVARDPERESLSMVEYFKKHFRSRNHRRGEYDAVRRTELIVRVVPRLSACPSDPEKHVRFCQQQLMLRKPFRRVSQLTDGYADAVEAHNAMIRQESCDTDADIEAEVANYEDDADYDPVAADDGAGEELLQEDEWMLLCKHLPSLNGQDGDNEHTYEEYMEYDWSAAAARYNVATADTFVSDQRQTATGVGDIAHVSADSLVGNQRAAFDLVASHADRNDTEPIRAIFSGTAGTGKSHLIHALRSHLGDRCKVVTPTGVAAFSVSGTTAHHLFHLPVQKASPFVPLNGDSLRNMQDEHAGTSYYIIDEMSMIGCRTLGMIDERLRQAFSNAADQLFGGRSVILVGDFGQLPPVGDSPLWSVSRLSRALDIRGQSAFAMFDTAVVLDRVVRQAGDSEFRDALVRLRDAETTDADYRLFSRCFMNSLAIEGEFQSAAHLYPTKEKVNDHNLRKLSELHCRTNPVARITAEHRPNVPSARKADPDQAGGLRQVVYLAKNARVMLTTNLWVAAGLVNGCVGTVLDIVYSGDKRPPSLPDFVVCHFPQYRGPAYNHDKPNTVPITPVQRTWLHANSMPVSTCRSHWRGR